VNPERALDDWGRGVANSGAPPKAQAVWRRTLELARSFDQASVFLVVFDVLRTAGHDTGTMTRALALGRDILRGSPGDLVARRACQLLERAILFMGGDARPFAARPGWDGTTEKRAWPA